MAKTFFFYKHKTDKEFVKRIFDCDKKEETFLVVDYKPQDGANFSISLYDNVSFFLDKSYTKSNSEEFEKAFNNVISDCA